MTKRQSVEWQGLAEIPDAEFEAMLQTPGRRAAGGILAAWHGTKARRLASLERMATELRAAGWAVFQPKDQAGMATTIASEKRRDPHA